MSNGAPDRRVYDDQILPSKKNAAKKTERLVVFNLAVNMRWAGEDISMIQRFEKPSTRHNYAMWRFPKAVVK